MMNNVKCTDLDGGNSTCSIHHYRIIMNTMTEKVDEINNPLFYPQANNIIPVSYTSPVV